MLQSNVLRRLFSILLLAVFVLPLVLPLFALGQDADAGVPACCRRNGKHHCMMSIGERTQLASHDPQFQGPVEKCPYCPASAVASHPNPLAAPAAQAIFAEIVSHPTSAAQTESKWRMARDRSRQKRGPPLFS